MLNHEFIIPLIFTSSNGPPFNEVRVALITRGFIPGNNAGAIKRTVFPTEESEYFEHSKQDGGELFFIARCATIRLRAGRKPVPLFPEESLLALCPWNCRIPSVCRVHVRKALIVYR